MLLVCTVYSVLYSEIALSRNPIGLGHIHIHTFLLKITDIVASQNIDLSSWDILYIATVSSLEQDSTLAHNVCSVSASTALDIAFLCAGVRGFLSPTFRSMEISLFPKVKIMWVSCCCLVAYDVVFLSGLASLFTRVWEMLGSNLRRDTGYPNCGFLCFFSSPSN
jgi:hypothetical protein